MNEKIKTIIHFIVFSLIFFVLGAVGGYYFGQNSRLAEIEGLTAQYTAIQHERDTTLERIAEDNKRLRDGNQRAQIELDAATARANRLEEYIRSAGVGNQQVTSDSVGAGQNLEEASRIVERYLGEQQTPKTDP